MCDKRDKLLLSIARFERLAREGLDPVTIERFRASIKVLQQRLLGLGVVSTPYKKREPDGTNKRSEWRVGQRVSRKDSVELGRVVEVNGTVKVKWDGGRISVFKHGDMANVELTGRE